jgi:hypothetical protein
MKFMKRKYFSLKKKRREDRRVIMERISRAAEAEEICCQWAD